MAHIDDATLIAKTRNLARYFTEQRQVAWVALVGTILWGLIGYFKMPQRKDPDIPVVTALVITPWPGMDAERIEDRVTRRIEAVVAENKHVETVRSVSRTNVSYVYVELKEGMTETGEVFDDIGLRLNGIRDLPPGAGPIQFIKDFGSTAALMLTVASPRLEEVQVSLRADQVRAAIEQLRAGAAPGNRVSVVYNFPPSISAGSVARPAQLYLAQAEEDGILRDARLLEGPQFVGVDGISDLPDSAILAHLHGFIKGRLRAAEFHPDAWQPAVVRDPATTRARLLAVAGDKYSYQELEQYTDELKRTFQTVPQVTKVDRLGVLDEQVTLSFSQERLASYGITLGRLRDVLQARNTALGGGQMEVGDRTVTLEPSGEFRDAREIGGVIVGSSGAGVPLYLRDLVNVDREYQNPPRYLNQYSWADSAGQWHRGRAVTLALQMRPGEKIGDFGHAVDSALAVVRHRLPPDLILARTSDQPLQVEENIHLFMNSLYEAVILVVLVALVGFWEWRSALLMALSIPLTLAMTFGMTAALGIDLQQVSIASLIIALGLLVDVPVVAGDAIKRELDGGKPRLIAALARTHEAGPGDPLRHDHQHRGLPAAAAAHGERRALPLQPAGRAHLLADRVADRLHDVHPAAGLLPPAAEPETSRAARGAPPRRVRRLVLPGGPRGHPAPLAGGGRLPGLPRPGRLDHEPAQAPVLPQGPPVPLLRRGLAAGGRPAQRHPRGHRPGGGTDPAARARVLRAPRRARGPERARLADHVHRRRRPAVLVLVQPRAAADQLRPDRDPGADKWDTPGLTQALQDQISREVPGARVDVRQLEMGPPVGVPVAIRLSGDDMPTLQALSAQLMGVLRRNPHAERVHQDWGAQSFTVDVAIDPDRANRAGLTNADVAVSTAVGLNGLEVTSMYRGDQIVPVVARLRMDERARLGDLHNMYVYSSQGGQKVSLPQIASLSTELRPEQIKRRNQFRTITVQAFPRGGSLPSEVLTYSRKDIDRFAASLPPGFRLQIAGEYEKQQSGFGEMTLVLLISVALIFLALTVQFQNAIKPFIVFGAIPYGFVGAVAGLWVMGSPFGFMGFLGIASLVGVIVSHVIVLFDFIEEAREKGEGLEEALLDAGIQRLRPVLITVGATLFALVPLAMHGGPLWEPLCYAQIGGLAIATVITLLLVPVFYAITVKDLKLVRWEA